MTDNFDEAFIKAIDNGFSNNPLLEDVYEIDTLIVMSDYTSYEYDTYDYKYHLELLLKNRLYNIDFKIKNLCLIGSKTVIRFFIKNIQIYFKPMLIGEGLSLRLLSDVYFKMIVDEFLSFTPIDIDVSLFANSNIEIKNGMRIVNKCITDILTKKDAFVFDDLDLSFDEYLFLNDDVVKNIKIINKSKFNKILLPYCMFENSTIEYIYIENCNKYKRIGIKYGAFYNCKNLKTVDIKCSVEFETYSFYKCINLTALKLLSESWFDEYVFNECSNLKTVYWEKMPKNRALYLTCFNNCKKIKCFVSPYYYEAFTYGVSDIRKKGYIEFNNIYSGGVNFNGIVIRCKFIDNIPDLFHYYALHDILNIKSFYLNLKWYYEYLEYDDRYMGTVYTELFDSKIRYFKLTYDFKAGFDYAIKSFINEGLNHVSINSIPYIDC